MNIFVLDSDPRLAAIYQCDKHVVKMILESTQLLCGPFQSAPYKRTHYNHPCAKWVRASRENYLWLFQHALALSNEYSWRYAKKHSCLDKIYWCGRNFQQLEFSGEKLTPWALAMPDDCKKNSTVESYRTYYVNHKRSFAKWKRRLPPYWWPY